MQKRTDTLESVFNGSYRGKTQFCHTGRGVFSAWNDFESAAFTPPSNASFLTIKECAYQALAAKRST